MYLLFDIGSSNTRMAVSRGLEGFGDPVSFETPGDFDEAIQLYKEKGDELSEGEPVKGVGGGVTGQLDRERRIVNSPNLPEWVGKPLKEKLGETFQSREVHLENDTAVVGLGEMKDGAGRGFNRAAYMTVSTGVGGALYVDGRIERGGYNLEPGHQIIDLGDMKSLEELISGGAMEKRFGKSSKYVEERDVWEEFEKNLAVGFHNVILHWVPEAIILGGAVSLDTKVTLEGIINNLEGMKLYPDLPHIKKAELGHFGGLNGAMHYLKRQLQKKSDQ